MARRKMGWHDVKIGSLTELPKPVSHEFAEFGLEPDSSPPPATKKRQRRKIPKTTSPKPATKKVQTAEKYDIDYSSECPCCRSLKRCGCEEHDRTFVRRTRFEVGLEKVARCNICLAPLSVVYLRRVGIDIPPYELSEFCATYACASCCPDSLCTMIIRGNR